MHADRVFQNLTLVVIGLGVRGMWRWGRLPQGFPPDRSPVRVGTRRRPTPPVMTRGATPAGAVRAGGTGADDGSAGSTGANPWHVADPTSCTGCCDSERKLRHQRARHILRKRRNGDAKTGTQVGQTCQGAVSAPGAAGQHLAGPDRAVALEGAAEGRVVVQAGALACSAYSALREALRVPEAARAEVWMPAASTMTGVSMRSEWIDSASLGAEVGP